MPDQIRLVIDTDIGDNIDDSLALTLACRDPRVELAGVSTVHGNTVKRAELARAILKRSGRSRVPMAPGCDQPLISPIERMTPLLAEIHPSEPVPARQLRRRFFDLWTGLTDQYAPLHILALGPLTNVALGLKIAPELRENVEVTAMAGAFDTERIDTNVRLDPEAAYIVLHSGVPVRLVPLDLTLTCPLPAWVPDAMARSSDPLIAALGKTCRRWQELSNRDLVIPHDPLTLFAAIEHDAFLFQSARVTVALSGEQRGRATLKPDEDSNVQVATSVDAGRFYTWLYKTLRLSEGNTPH